MSKLYDPLLKKTAHEATAATHVEEAAPKMVQATVGGVTGPKIPVLVDISDRLCVPVPQK